VSWLRRAVALILFPFVRIARPVTSRPLVLAIVAGTTAVGVTVAGVESLTWMETASFCGRCHTMTPELEAHELSTHADVECAECHVGKGIVGLARAKIGGMRQMLALIAGDYARPIPEAADAMPPPDETCGRCHNPGRERSNRLLVRSHYAEDEKNTGEQVALVLRLSDSAEQETRGIHWHVLSKVEYVGTGESVEKDKAESHAEPFTASEIQWIGVERPNGTTEQYIAKSAVEISEQAGQRAVELKANGKVARMNCYDCHNRVGHDFPLPSRAIDDAITDRRIDQSMPFIKKRGLEVVTGSYANPEEALAAIRRLQSFYHGQYPNFSLADPEKFAKTFQTLWEIYKTSTHPEMSVAAEAFPNFLGHTASAGCFRCHDGGHYKIVDGRLTGEAIPSACSTCHSFPSAGQATSLPIGSPPTSHKSRLWVFDHKMVATSADPAGQTCGGCHARSYCSNCHESGATLVKHDAMLFNHAAIIRNTGESACAYCHQKPFCARCHPNGTAAASGTTAAAKK